MSIAGHVLIIDDELVLRQTLARVLQHAGFEVTTAADGQEGLELISHSNFDQGANRSAGIGGCESEVEQSFCIVRSAQYMLFGWRCQDRHDPVERGRECEV